ncbi:MAG: YesL family protein [Halanaerobiaceae bacterium]
MDFNFLQPGSTFYKIAEWIQRFVFANLLWLFFTLIGLGVFGIMPATAALYSIVRKWNKGNTSFPLFKTFWREYKTNFIRANLLGLIMFFLGFILYFNLNYYREQTAAIYSYIYFLMLIFSFLYIILFLYLFPLYVNYELKFHHLIKNAFLISILSPAYTLMIVLAMAGVVMVFMVLPSLIPFLGISSLAFVNMWGAEKSFSKVEKKIKDHKKEDKDSNNKKEEQPENSQKQKDNQDNKETLESSKEA